MSCKVIESEYINILILLLAFKLVELDSLTLFKHVRLTSRRANVFVSGQTSAIYWCLEVLVAPSKEV